MAASAQTGTGSQDSLASLARLKQVETDGDASLRAVRGKIDLTLSKMRDDGEAQIQAARKQADQDASAMLVRAQKAADDEAARILSEAKAALVQRSNAAPADLGKVWDDILRVLFGEFN